MIKASEAAMMAAPSRMRGVSAESRNRMVRAMFLIGALVKSSFDSATYPVDD